MPRVRGRSVNFGDPPSRDETTSKGSRRLFRPFTANSAAPISALANGSRFSLTGMITTQHLQPADRNVLWREEVQSYGQLNALIAW